MNDFALLILRSTAGAFMLFAHGLPKLKSLIFSKEINFPDPLSIGSMPSLLLTSFSEFFCSLLLILGLFTRASLIPLIVTMLVAAFVHHAEDPFSQKEKALLFLMIYIFLFLTGPGKYSLGRIMRIKSTNKLLRLLIE